MFHRLSIFWLLIASGTSSSVAFQPAPPTKLAGRISTQHHHPRTRSTQVDILRSPRPISTRRFAEKSGKSRGVYVRPSGAIERGSGFFVPGLEGPRVRVLFGTVLLALTALNHVLVDASGFSLEEVVAIGFSFLVLLQAAIEFGKEELIVEDGSKSRGKSLLQKDLVQQWNMRDEVSEHEKEKIQWAAASYLSVTPATQMLLLSKDSILYRLGTDSPTQADTIAEGVQAALEQLRQSKGGRISLPNSHPAVEALGLQDARTIVLQRTSDQACLVMSSSDQLLASFTSSDLKWLGQIARYIQL